VQLKGALKVKLSLCFTRTPLYESVLGEWGIAPLLLWPWH